MRTGNRFQFHKGTIKPDLWSFGFMFPKLFQFHKGTIKPHCFRECNILIYKHIYKCKGTIFY